MKRLSLRSKVKLLCIVAFAAGLLTGHCFELKQKPAVVQVEVVEGDTLWTIAESFTDDEVDIRKTVYEIRKTNNLRTAEIYPGDVILIPLEVINE